MNKKILFRKIFFGIICTSALIVAKLFTSATLTITNISVALIGGVVGGLVYGEVLSYYKKRKEKTN